jgi:isopentenyl diphosphate isomerase/L-lactate dehydrogenase-like FMN-dependent dehydrogenase
MRELINLEDYRRAARRRLPRVIFDFIDGGADDEFTVGENRRAFEDYALLPAVLAGVGDDPGTEVEVLGQRLSLPVMVGPTGTSRIAGRAGEIGGARGAEAAGTTAVIANGTSVPLDRVVDSVETPPWLQIMFFQDRRWTAKLLERAASLGVRVIVATVDVPVIGNRERDARHGLALPVHPRLRWAPSIARRPRWLAETLVSPPVTSEGLAELNPDLPLRQALEGSFSADQTWEYLEWIRARWDGPLVVKGVMRAEDAIRAVEIGCEGVVVSNHGGRQLDAVPGSLDMLPEVVAAVGDRADVLLDGGIRRGTDVVKALALGAKACLIGRPWLWGLKAGGTAGVTDVLEILRAELRRALILLGAPSVGALDEGMLLRRPGSGWARLAAGPAGQEWGGAANLGSQTGGETP